MKEPLENAHVAVDAAKTKEDLLWSLLELEGQMIFDLQERNNLLAREIEALRERNEQLTKYVNCLEEGIFKATPSPGIFFN